MAKPVCVGRFNCASPEKCPVYEECLGVYMGAEIRNEVLTI